MASSLKHQFDKQVFRNWVYEPFCEKTDVPRNYKQTAVHTNLLHLFCHLRKQVGQHIWKYLCCYGYRAQILKVVVREYIFSQTNQNPKGFFLTNVIDQKIGHQIVHSLAIEKIRISYGVCYQNIPKTYLKRMLVQKSSWDVFLYGTEHGFRVGRNRLYESIVVAWMFELVVIGLCSDHE